MARTTNRKELDMQIGDASLADLPEIVQIYNETILSRLATADLEPVSIESRQAWFNEHNPQRRPLWVAKLNKKVIGWLSFQSFYGRPAYNGTAEISVYVAFDYRRHGIAKTLLCRAVEHAPTLGLHTLLGFIFDHNEPSLRLFKGIGFEEWGHLPRIARPDNDERGLKIVGRKV